MCTAPGPNKDFAGVDIDDISGIQLQGEPVNSQDKLRSLLYVREIYVAKIIVAGGNSAKLLRILPISMFCV
jgi:hypothetical protein